MQRQKMRIRLSLRQKLLLVSLVLLIIPWVGSRYIHDMENYLRENQQQALLNRAQDVAAILQTHHDLFNSQPVDTTITHRHLYVRPLKSAIQLDGYANDWQMYNKRIERFNDANLLYKSPAYKPGSLKMQQQVGRFSGFLYVLIKVTDKHIVYRDPQSLHLDRDDHLTIAMETPQGKFVRYQLATIAPGWINAHLISNQTEDPLPVAPELRIKGEWQETASGYNIEFRIPLSMLGRRLSFTITDVDDPQSRHPVAVIGSSNNQRLQDLDTIMIPSPAVEQLLERLSRPASRIWVIDQQFRVIGTVGDINADGDDNVDNGEDPAPYANTLLDRLYQLILEQPATEFIDELSSASRLEGKEIKSALSGHKATQWRANPDRKTNILTAAYPVYSGQHVIGAVAIEETNQRILLLQNRAMEILINLTVVALFCSILVLLLFATRLSWRIRQLRNEADQAIAEDGRVQGTITTSGAGDEVGDLSRSFSAMLHRLTQYNRYLETLASKLSHELRTPITVVKSSLDNLDSRVLDDNSRQYTQRAKEGLQRLNHILNRMSEATRLEQTLQSEAPEVFNLAKLIPSCAYGYQQTQHHVIQFTCNAAASTLNILGSPELIAQLLDKLVENALDFAEADTPIIIDITTEMDVIILKVKNQGPAIPEDIADQLFDSMVSQRKQRSETPHLGLGLYIVRMISEFHHGQVLAQNRADCPGTEFILRLPIHH